MRKIAVIILGAVLLASGLGPLTSTQAQNNEEIIQEIVVEGANRVDPETVGSYLTVRVGDPFNPEQLDESLRRLFATGLFSDVTFRREGSSLIIRVVENPIINRIAFEGNDKLSDSDLASEIPLRPRSVYTRARVQASVRRMLELYRQRGRFAATINPQVINREQNRVDLVFEIDEGSVTGIRRITFIGNRAFSDSSLRDVIQTRESAWWRFLTSADVYDPDRLRIDQELLRRHYLSSGYAEFRVISAVAELTPDREDFFITFTLEEGPRYRFGAISIETSLRGTEAAQFEDALAVEEGDWYDASEVEETVQELADAAGTLGYAFVEVSPRALLDREEQTVSITFEIREGPRVFIERIEIVGNQRTRDEVIRRELLVAEGDAFNTAKIRQSRRRLINLDFFEEVEITNRQGSAPDQTIVVIRVEEKSTGQLTFGAGYSTDDGVLGTVGIRERNFMGRGQNLSLEFLISQRSQSIDFSFTEPYFLDRNLSFGVDVFRVVRDFEDESAFDQRETGLRTRFGFQINEFLSDQVEYEINDSSIRGLSSQTSPFVRIDAGSVTKSSIANRLTYDTRDNRLDPTSGYLLSGRVEFAGVGGSTTFVKFEGRAAYHYPLSPSVVLSGFLRAGHVEGIGERARVTERFFLGGTRFRGFEVSGVGPRDANTGTALGGKTYYVATAEASFPIGLPPELGIRGRVFTDVGAAFGIDFSDPAILDSSMPRVSVGVGISWSSPLGPIQFDLGFPVIKRSFDQRQIFSFTFGARF